MATIIPIVIALLVIMYMIVPTAMFIQPLTMKIIESRPNSLHEGDKFKIVVSVTNPNFFIIDFGSASTTFDKNAVEYHYDGCSGTSMGHRFWLFQSTEIEIPTICADEIANSVGTTNTTVHMQYHINGKSYSMSASKILTILPKTKS